MEQSGDQLRIPASFIRGGTSKAVFFRREHLPADREAWAPIFLAALGSPDPYGRQLNGMGGGLSSLSKVCVVGRSDRPSVDVDYTFAQVAVREQAVSYAGNCGNISSAVGPYAVDEGLVTAPDGLVTVKAFNTNTAKRIDAKFHVAGGRAMVSGDLVIPGVSGTGAPVQLEFVEPGGAGTGRLFPTGNVLDTFDVPGRGAVRASVVDAANLCCFALAEDLGLTGTEMPRDLDHAEAVHQALEAIAAQAVALIAGQATPKSAKRITLIGFVSPPQRGTTLADEVIGKDDVQLTGRMFSSGQPHRALPLTSALCMAVAAQIPGTTVHRMAQRRAGDGGTLRIASPSGVLTVAAMVDGAGASARAISASVFRTQRRLFDGGVYIPG